jgi:AmpD protein
MNIDSTHRLAGARWRPSEHCERLRSTDKEALDVFQWDAIVVHCVSLPEGEFGTGAPARLFTGELDCNEHPSFKDLDGLRVAPHLLIDRTGDIEQFVAFDRGAWHAGQSSWRGRPSCNRFSLGIELEGTWNSGYTDAQYVALTEVCAALCVHYPSLSPSAIVGHQEIAPGRKQDPGPCFDWPRLLVPLHRRLVMGAV